MLHEFSRRIGRVAIPLMALAGLCADAPMKLVFREVAAERGVKARLRNGDSARRWIPEANGTGAAWLDYDNDGWMDLLIVNGADMQVFRDIAAGKTPPKREDGVFLLHNLGKGRFGMSPARPGSAIPIGALPLTTTMTDMPTS